MSKRFIFRVQDKSGLGPFRPGFTKMWVDDDGPDQLPPFTVEFGDDLIPRLQTLINTQGGACGCGVAERTTLGRWFTQTERRRLNALGYRPVMMTADAVLAESVNQLVFWRRRPLRSDAVVIPWSDLA